MDFASVFVLGGWAATCVLFRSRFCCFLTIYAELEDFVTLML
jgi:hypothetical protein